MSTSQQSHQLNYEDLGTEVAKLDLAHVQKASATLTSSATAMDLPQVCSLYQTVRPFLSIISSIPFLPAKLKTAISLFMSGMDLICPSGAK